MDFSMPYNLYVVLKPKDFIAFRAEILPTMLRLNVQLFLIDFLVYCIVLNKKNWAVGI
jgi:hypothetical protein